MPFTNALCYPETCPAYTFPSKEDVAKEDAEAEAERESWYAFFAEMEVDKKPQTPLEKCQEYCRAVQAAEAEKCRVARAKIAYALKMAGCPSKVLPPRTSKKKKSPPKPTAKKATATKSEFSKKRFNAL